MPPSAAVEEPLDTREINENDYQPDKAVEGDEFRQETNLFWFCSVSQELLFKCFRRKVTDGSSPMK